MEPAELGRKYKEYGLNGEEWDRTLLVCGSMIVMGALGIAIACYRWAISGMADWILFVTGTLLAGISGYVLYKLRPRLISLAIHENGLFVCERDGDTSFRWTEISKIEESVHQTKAGEVREVLIEAENGTGLRANALTISSFDDFLTELRERTSRPGVEWTEAGDARTGSAD